MASCTPWQRASRLGSDGSCGHAAACCSSIKVHRPSSIRIRCRTDPQACVPRFGRGLCNLTITTAWFNPIAICMCFMRLAEDTCQFEKSAPASQARIEDGAPSWHEAMAGAALESLGRCAHAQHGIRRCEPSPDQEQVGCKPNPKTHPDSSAKTYGEKAARV